LKYFEVSVSTNHACADSVAAILFEAGSEGVATYDKQDLIDLIENGKTWDYIEENLMEQDGSVVIVKGFFLQEVSVGDLTEAISILRLYNESTGSLEVTAQWLDDADYANEWKKYYKTIVIRNVAIVPRWLQPEADKLNVLIDPGAAFGTGSHETTSMCLELMQDIPLQGKSVIDLGCGSAILGMTALKLGAGSAVFVDIDEMALDVSKDNVALNGMTERSTFYCGDLRDTDYKAQVMFANITADILCMFAPDLAAHIEENGYLLLSGIIDREYGRVRSTFEAQGYEVQAHCHRGDWHALLTVKKA